MMAEAKSSARKRFREMMAFQPNGDVAVGFCHPEFQGPIWEYRNLVPLRGGEPGAFNSGDKARRKVGVNARG